MPAYFFHLAFELYNRGAGQYLPHPIIDIFEDSLPTRHFSSWASYIAPRRRTSPSLRRASHDKKKEERQGSSSDTHVDWRAGELMVESITMEADTQLDNESTKPPQLSEVEKQRTVHGLPTRGKYVPSHPRSTELGFGVVHLYRDKEPALELETNASDLKGTTSAPSSDQAYVDHDCTTLCILAVPSYMTPSDLLGWVGEETRNVVTHLRLVRTERSNRYMVLMKFRESKNAKAWQKAWNGKLFNVMEPENCHVVFVKSIQFQSSSNDTDNASFPDTSNDPFTPAIGKLVSADTTPSADVVSKHTNSLSSKPVAPVLELPTCPVCLERMDETNGLATIFCQHVFHCACLQKWRSSGCPVCRYTQDEPMSKASKSSNAQNECNTCGAADNLWICLICGHVGCGRYDEAHAFAHFQHTNHSFAMNIGTQHIWDYLGDEYVHRLIQNKADGKLVELPGSTKSEKSGSDDGLLMDKLESIGQEYTQLLQSQLDSQRTYFEEQVERAVDKASVASAAAERAADQAVKAWSRLEAIEASNRTATTDTIPSLEKEKERWERKAQKLESMTREMQREWSESKVINESLMDRISHLEKQLEEANLKNSEMEEQNRDLSFFISGMEKLKDQGEEIKEGTVSVPDPPTGKKKKKKAGQK